MRPSRRQNACKVDAGPNFVTKLRTREKRRGRGIPISLSASDTDRPKTSPKEREAGNEANPRGEIATGKSSPQSNVSSEVAGGAAARSERQYRLAVEPAGTGRVEVLKKVREMGRSFYSCP